MISKNLNIKQVSNHSITDEMPKTTHSVLIPYRLQTNNANKPFTIDKTSEEVEYVTIISNENIIKFGYSVEQKGILYPIYLEINGKFTPFFPGTSGIYEMQPEDLKNGTTTDTVITSVQVPLNVAFVFDYVVPIS